MDRQDILKKIGEIITDIKEQHLYLLNNIDNISQLDIELLTAHSHFLTDHAEILKKLNEDYKGHVFIDESHKNESSVALPKEDNSIIKETLTSDSKQQQHIIEEHDLGEELKQGGIIVEKAMITATVNDRISEQLQSTKKSISSEFSKSKITDLKSAINMNDRLLFIKHLFNGYSLAYSEAIEILNRYDQFEDAKNFLELNYAKKNNWETHKETVEKFYSLLKRRYN